MSTTSQNQSNTLNRRNVLKASAFAGITFLANPATVFTYAANEKLRFACIGVGGRAAAGVNPGLRENLVAVAEVDPQERGKKNLEKISKQSPSTKIYTDFRQLFDKHSELDAVWIGTPDHTHFPAAIRALEAGAGVYCEKPLTWSVNEARTLREVANKKKVPTQMGNQGHSSESIRQIVDHLRSGSLGTVTKVDCISNRGFSAKGKPKPGKVPAGLDWEAWLGPAADREYHGGLHPFNWRGWLDFGTGSLGDMGCHTVDGAVWGLKLYEADQFEVEPVVGKPTENGFAPQAVIVYRFPKRGEMPAVNLTWYHGGKQPPRPEALGEGVKVQREGTYYYGTKGLMSSGSHCQNVRLYPDSFAKETPKPKQHVERSKKGHTGDFITACKDRSAPQPSSHFDYAARLTEIVLLGNIACAVGEKLTYSMKEGRILNNDNANALLARKPRKGWTDGYSS